MRIRPRKLWFSVVAWLVCRAAASAADLSALEESFIKAVESVRPAVVAVTAPYRPAEGGRMENVVLSGVIVRPGFIASISNLLSRCDTATVTFADGREARARVAGYDPVFGLGVLKCDEAKAKPLRIAKSGSLRAGSIVVLVGNAFGLRHSVSWGLVSGLRRDIQVQGRPPVEMIQMTAPVNPGDSGCAVVNLRGELVGLASSRFDGPGGGCGATGINFAVPADRLQEPIEQIVSKGRVERGWLGVTIAPAFLPRSGRRAVQVVEVSPDSPGAAAGLQTGDVILSVNGKPVYHPKQLEAIVLLTPPSQTVRLETMRRGRRSSILAQVGCWRPSCAPPLANIDSLVHRLPENGSVRLSGADRGRGDAALRRRLQQMQEEILQLLKEQQP